MDWGQFRFASAARAQSALNVLITHRLATVDSVLVDGPMLKFQVAARFDRRPEVESIVRLFDGEAA